MAVPTLVSTPFSHVSPAQLSLRKGDLLVGLFLDSSTATWPESWTEVQPGLAWTRYDGLMVDHIPFVYTFRNAEVVSPDDLSSTSYFMVSVDG